MVKKEIILEEIKEVVNAEVPKNSYFATQVINATEEFSKYGITVKDVSYVAKELLNFENVADLLNGYVIAQTFISNSDLKRLPVKEHVKLYKKLGSNNIPSWSFVVHDLAAQGYSKGRNLTTAFNVAFKLGNITKVGEFLDFADKLEKKTLDQQISLYEQSKTTDDVVLNEQSAFDIMQIEQDLNLPLKVMKQNDYRSKWHDSSHAYEHAITMLDHD